MRWSLPAVVFASLAACGVANADVKLPTIFSDHMLLQHDRSVPIWGWATAGEAVSVQVGAQTSSATAGADGKWSVKLDALPVSDAPMKLVVSGRNRIEINDVLVGDVWLCSGQSNMGFPLDGAITGPAAVKTAADERLRLFVVEANPRFDPQDDCKGKWTLCTPAAAGRFSAVGYFFGRDLREDLKIPIGLICSAFGGTSSQAWTSRAGLEGRPALREMMAQFAQDEPMLRQKTETYEQQTVPQWEKEMEIWRRDVNPGYQQQLQQWNAAVKQAQATGQPAPPKPQPATPRPNAPAVPNRLTPTTLYNGMIVPILPYAIRGFAWYQGEHNTFNPGLYRELLPAMIADWRQHWGEGDLPFVYVQIADNAPRDKGGLNLGKWALVRETEAKLNVPVTAMAVSLDVGDPSDVHARNKQPVGQRLALAARHAAYGESLVYSGPVFDRMEPWQDGMRITFRFADAGLTAGIAPTDSPFAKPAQAPLVGFEVAGEDRVFHPADATIDGSGLVVRCAQVAKPLAVRYGWGDAPSVNLYNHEGLPAVPFRTDDWEK